MFLRFLLCLFLVTGFASKTWAVFESKIAFLVGTTPVFERSLKERMRFVLLMTGAPTEGGSVSKEMRASVIRGMIDEILQLKAANAIGIKVTDEQVKTALQGLAKNNGMTYAQLKDMFQQKGVPFSILQRQIKTQIAWTQYIQRKYIRDVAILPAEVKKQRQRLLRQKGKTEYRVAEIILYSPKSGRAALEQRLRDIIMLLQHGSPFPGVARQFSGGPTASKGGYVGWMHTDDLEESAVKALDLISPGMMTMPVPLSSGYGLYVLIEKRQNNKMPKNDMIYASLQQNRFELAARKELVQLRQKSVIEYR